MKENILSIPLLINDEGSSVLAHIIMFHRRIWRIVLIMSPPRISDIKIKGIPITMEFPKSGNRNLIPVLIVVVQAIEIHRTGICRLIPIEFPHSAE